jgi:hypothetical protein
VKNPSGPELFFFGGEQNRFCRVWGLVVSGGREWGVRKGIKGLIQCK